MGSKHMDVSLKKFVEDHYTSGKRDLYAAFILRCLELCQATGRVAMVTQQSWMFLSSFADLRAIPNERLIENQIQNNFTGILREACIEKLVHLGEYAFEDSSAAGAFATMFVMTNSLPKIDNYFITARLVGLKSVEAKKAILLSLKYSKSNNLTTSTQHDFISIPKSPICYYLFSIITRYFKFRKAPS